MFGCALGLWLQGGLLFANHSAERATAFQSSVLALPNHNSQCCIVIASVLFGPEPPQITFVAFLMTSGVILRSKNWS